MEEVKINTIKPNPDNPRFIRDEKFKQLVQSIKEFPKMLKLRPIVVDEHMIALGGNMRLAAAEAAGRDTIWIERALGLSPEEKKEFIIKDNLSYGEWDFDILANNWNLSELEAWGMDIPDMKIQDPYEDDFVIPKIIDTDIKPGDLIQIGPHRLICGDSRDPDTVKKLLGKEKPNLMVTDPPYGVEYAPEWRHKANKKKSKIAVGKVHNDDQVDWTLSYALFPGSVAYVWHSALHGAEVLQNLEDCKFRAISQIIWAKDSLVLSRGDYHWQHEPCWYVVKKGSTHDWQGQRDKTTIWNIGPPKNADQVSQPGSQWYLVQTTPADPEPTHTTVWRIGRPKRSDTGHSTQKPVECMARPIQNNSKKGDTVYDPFLGSGTTMVAADQLGRICYGIELGKEHCQVIIERMHQLNPDHKITINNKEWASTTKG